MISIELVSKINKTLEDLNEDLNKATIYFPLDLRDEIAQEIRIHLWKKAESDLLPDSTQEDVDNFIRLYLYPSATICSKIIKTNKYKYYAKINQLSSLKTKKSKRVMAHYYDMEESALRQEDYKADLESYKNILSKSELFLLNYLIEVGSDFKNKEAIDRQLGRTGKGSSAYALNNIARKIRKAQNSLKIS